MKSYQTSAVFSRDESVLLSECKRIGPAGISPLNIGRANFAITYSTDFSELVADLLLLYKTYLVPNPVDRLAKQFQHMNIHSCRGAEMNKQRVEYLVTHSVTKLPKVNGYRGLNHLVKEKCPLCGRWKRGLVQHMQSAHPDA